MATASTPESPQPESVAFDTFKELKNKYGETAAKSARNAFGPKAFAKGEELVTFLAEKIPVKSHFPEIIQEKKPQDFLVSSFLSQYQKIEIPKEPKPVFSAKELLKKIGYSLSNPTTSEALLKFAHFYKTGERICTMNDVDGRLKDNYVFFLTHKNAANIPHAKDLDKNNLTPEWTHYLKKNGITDINGIRPKSEDPYGTSVLSVQIDIETGTVLKIINRYNHSVKDPDFTFGGNLDKLIPGLEQAIYRKTKFKNPPERKLTDRPETILAVDGKFYYYTQEREGVYWGDGFVYANGRMTVVDPSSERVVDGYILSSKEKKQSPFLEGYQEPYLEGIQKVKFPSKDTIEILDAQGNKATLKTKDGCLISFHSDELTEAGDNFFRYNNTLTSLSAPKLKTAGNNCLRYNEFLTFLSCDNLEEVGDHFFYHNDSITSLSLNNLKKVKDGFFFSNNSLTSLSLNNLEEVKDYFFRSNESITSLSLNNLKKTGDHFFYSNESITSLSLNNLKKTGAFFFYYNNSITFLSCDNLEEVGYDFFRFNNSIISLSLNNLKIAGNFFFCYNNSITSLSLNNLEEAGTGFFNSHKSLKRLLPKDFSNGICVSLKKKKNLKTVHKQKIQETVPSNAPSNGTFLLNAQGTVICGEKDGKNAHGK